MLTRVKTFAATGIATAGRLYAGDLNALQDAVAAASDFAQTIGVSALQVGDSTIQLIKFGTSEARVTAALRVDGLFRALAGVIPGTFTTTQRDAIVAPPTATVIYNSTNGRLEVNLGTSGTPNWSALAPTSVGAASISTSMLQDGAVTAIKLAAALIDATKIAGSLKPSVSAAAGDEALRALGTSVGNALPGDHWSTTPEVSVNGGTKTNGQTYVLSAPAAGTYVLEWGAGALNAGGQGSGGTITNGKTSGTSVYSDVGGSGGPVVRAGVVLTNGETITFTVALSGSGVSLIDCWATLRRTA